jgi:hypothetical protein
MAIEPLVNVERGMDGKVIETCPIQCSCGSNVFSAFAACPTISGEAPDHVHLRCITCNRGYCGDSDRCAEARALEAKAKAEARERGRFSKRSHP